MTEKPTLILSPRHTESSQSLWRKAVEEKWEIERFYGWKIPENFKPQYPVIYGEPLFIQMIADHLNISLPEPPEDFLCRLPEELTGRKVYFMEAGDARKINEKVFVKPPNKKTFKAGVYESGAGIPIDVADDETVLVQEVIQFTHEYRFFFMGGMIATGSSYMIDGIYAKTIDGWNDPSEIHSAATNFARDVSKYLKLTDMNLLDSAVMDVGFIKGRGWAVIEANEINASGCYNSDPLNVLVALYYATNKPGLDPYRANFYEKIDL